MKKSHFIWNMFGTIIASCLSSILLLIVVRINGVEIAGIFSIAFATSVILNAVGDFGIRILQVTDIKQQYTFGEYMALRIIVVFVMNVGLLSVSEQSASGEMTPIPLEWRPNKNERNPLWARTRTQRG